MNATHTTADNGLALGDRVRFRRPRSATWREGQLIRWSASRAGRVLGQVLVDTVGGAPLVPPMTARVRTDRLERIGPS